MLIMGHAVLVTGMSGVGKSTALAELARFGFTTVDTDYGHGLTSTTVNRSGANH
jgi:dephospho-CoA kinase